MNTHNDYQVFIYRQDDAVLVDNFTSRDECLRFILECHNDENCTKDITFTIRQPDVRGIQAYYEAVHNYN